MLEKKIMSTLFSIDENTPHSLKEIVEDFLKVLKLRVILSIDIGVE